MSSATIVVPQRALAQRVLSVDVLRGLTIALMILVNDPGDWSHVYARLDHATWNGFTLTDLVFPNFLFLVGASIIFSIDSRIARGESKLTLALHMFRRALTIFAIKMLLTAFPHFHMTHLRIFGVLTRIAVCYLIAGLICLYTRRARALLAISAVLLVGYWALMRFVPVPRLRHPNRRHAHPQSRRQPRRMARPRLQRLHPALAAHRSLYNHTRDPEGLLSTIPAIATTLLGSSPRSSSAAVRAKDWISLPAIPPAPNPPPSFSLHGLVSLGLGLSGPSLCPSTKISGPAPTSSSPPAGPSSSSLSATGSSTSAASTTSPAGKWLLWPWLVFGSNAITAFIVSNFLVEVALWIKVPAGALVNAAAPATRISAWQWIYRHIFARHDSTTVTSLAFALAFVALCFLPNLFLWRRKIFLKV